MIEALEQADVVAADLSTQNANVAYEIGRRHAFADRATVLTYPRIAGAGGKPVPPFDVQPIRHIGRAINREPVDESEWPYDGMNWTVVPLPGGCLFTGTPRRRGL